jgi:hypothetical protein
LKYDDYNKFRKKFFNIAAEISDNKSIEYTISNEDKFYNFKHVAERLGITAKQAMMVYILKHVDALCNDAKTGKTYSDETTYQRCLDVVNYMVLYAALDYEEQPHANNTELPRSTDSGADRNSENASKSEQWSNLSRTAQTRT